MHPNAEGVRRVVARILPLVEQLIARVTRDAPAAAMVPTSAPAGAPAKASE